MRRKLILIGCLLLLGAVVLPALVYYAGSVLVGPYDSPGGFPAFLGSIYLDAVRGQPAAWLLLLVPTLLLAVWRALGWLRKRQNPAPG